MVSPELRRLEFPQGALCWIKTNASQIKAIALDFRLRSGQLTKPDLSLETREISEMPLCRALPDIRYSQCGLPEEDFTLEIGRATVYEPQTQKQVQEPNPHVFFQRIDSITGERSILCLFPAQYILPEELDPARPEKGQRITKIEEKAKAADAEDLVYVVPEYGICALYGSAERIRATLGIEYSVEPLITFDYYDN